MRTVDSERSILEPISKYSGARRGLGLLLVGLLLGLALPLRVGAQEVRLSETYTSSNPEEKGNFGASVARAGDVNGDGTPDLLVGAPNESSGGTEGAGRAYLIDGANGKILHTLTSPTPEENGGFGISVARAGNTNGDGTPDLLVGADDESPSDTKEAGRAYLIDGAGGEVLHTLSSPTPEENGLFSFSVARAGDANGDGTPDLLVGAPAESPGGTKVAGRAYLIDGAGGEVLHTLSSPTPEEDGRFGVSVARARDVNGDGTPDLIVGAYRESPGGTDKAGRAYLIDGADGEVLHSLTSPNPEENGRFGFPVARAGDVNGDGTPDLLVGAPAESPGGTKVAGRTYLIDGAGGEVLHTLSSPTPEEDGRFGVSVARAGDVNGDGTPDLLVGAFESPGGTDSAGRTYLIDGASGEVLYTPISPNPEKKGRFGLSVAWAGDMNGDGTSNLLVGALTESPDGTDEAGRVYRFDVGDQTHRINPNEIPSTSASVKFTEPSGNNRLDGAETASVQVTIQNEGDGPARQVQARVQPPSHPHLSYPTAVSFGTVKAGASATERIQIQADREVPSDTARLTFQFEEANGFAPSPVKLQFETEEFIPPELTVADVGINDSNGNGVIEPGELVTVTARVKNESQGQADGVSATVNFGENVFATPDTRRSFDLGTLGPGEHQDVKFSLVTNQQAESVPVTVDLTEKYGEYGTQDVTLPLAFNRPTDQITEVQVEGQETDVQVQSGDQLSVDVETNIPTTPMDRPDAVAVVIGIRSYASEGVPNVEYARRDARIMRQYLTQTLGFREENILPRNPDGRMTYAEMRTLIQQKLPSYVKEGTSEVFVFYSGHGAPTTGENRQGYLVPSDTDPNFVSDANAYALTDVYNDLSEVGAKSVIIALDACFTGQAGSGEMMIKKASPSVLSVENPFLAIENGTAFLASSTEQVANWYAEKKHGMFTYFFLKGLKGAADANDDQTLTVAEMERYLTDTEDGVPYYSRRLHQRKQTPQIVARDKDRVLVRYEKQE